MSKDKDKILIGSFFTKNGDEVEVFSGAGSKLKILTDDVLNLHKLLDEYGFPDAVVWEPWLRARLAELEALRTVVSVLETFGSKLAHLK